MRSRAFRIEKHGVARAALVPVADMVNHAPRAGVNAEWGYDEARSPPISPDDEHRGRRTDETNTNSGYITISYKNALFVIVLNIATAAVAAGVSVSTVIEAAKQFTQLAFFLMEYFI